MQIIQENVQNINIIQALVTRIRFLDLVNQKDNKNG